MSDTKLKRQWQNPLGVLGSRRLPRERANTGAFVPWRTVPPRYGEAVRWECVDGRWVSVTVGHGENVGSVIVRDSSGRCEWIDSYEGALELARHWRTIDTP
jgi:hypothetical protein